MSQEFRINIDQTNDTAEDGVSGMKDIFLSIAKTLDGSLSDEDINTWFDNNTSGYMSEGSLGSLMIHFYPDTDNSRGHIRLSK